MARFRRIREHAAPFPLATRTAFCPLLRPARQRRYTSSCMALLLDDPDKLELEDQESFNLAIWERVLADEYLREVPYRIETDALGQVIMSPPPSIDHGEAQSNIVMLLGELLPHGIVATEAPLSTAGGVKAVDVVWMTKARRQPQRGKVCLTQAPEICIEIVSPNNSRRELREKKRLYFEAGADEVWFREHDGRMAFYLRSAPETAEEKSGICPEFPALVE